jgi:hypothetical protein
MKKYLLFLATTSLLACQPAEKVRSHSYNEAMMLTTNDWELIGYGYDVNQNGLLDSNEDRITNEEKGMIYVFGKNNKGYVFESSRVLTNAYAPKEFEWAFVENINAIDFMFSTVPILTLNKQWLILGGDLEEDELQMIAVYKSTGKPSLYPIQ